MSYTLLVQSDKPLGYWKLNSSTEDLSLLNNSASVSSSIQYSGLPLVANSACASIIESTSGSINIANTYDAFHRGFEHVNFSIEFWISFNSSVLDGSGYYKNISSSTQYFTNNKLKIIQLMNGSTEIGVIYYDYNRNTFRFKINDTDNSNVEAISVVRNLNTSFHIMASYKNKALSITVNGDEGSSGAVNDTSLFPKVGTSNYYFSINSNSFNSSAGMSYVINDLAFYDYSLNLEKIRKRVMWAYHNDKPNFLTAKIGSSLFEFEELDSHIALHYEHSGISYEQYKDIFNLKIEDTQGLKNKISNNFEIDTSYNPNASVVYSSDGIYLLNNASLKLNSYGRLFTDLQFTTFTAQIKFSGSSDYIFSIDQKDPNAILYAKLDTNGFYFYTYDVSAASTSLLSTASSSLISGSSYNFGICINSETFTMYGNSVSSSGTLNNFILNPDNTLIIGNMTASVNASNSSKIKNFGMSNLNITDFSTIDFTKNQMYMARLTSDLSISQIGYWVYSVPLSSFANSITGSKVTWDGMDNAFVETSMNRGFSWNTLYKGTSIPELVYNDVNRDVMIRVTVPYDYMIENVNQSFNNFQISLYNNLTFLSNDKNYELVGLSDSSSLQSFNIQRNDQPMGYRKDNFGLKFDKANASTTYVPGYAEIYGLTSALNNYGIDFWFKANSISTASSYILHLDYVQTSNDSYIDVYTDAYAASGVISTPEYYLYLNQSNNKLIYSPSAAKLYVNGQSVASNSASIKIGEYYHLMIDYGSASGYESHSVMTLNGLYETASSHSAFAYGNINIWNASVTQSDANLRYQSFIGNNSSVIIDSSSTVWQKNWNNDSITTATFFKIG